MKTMKLKSFQNTVETFNHLALMIGDLIIDQPITSSFIISTFFDFLWLLAYPVLFLFFDLKKIREEERVLENVC